MIASHALIRSVTHLRPSPIREQDVTNRQLNLHRVDNIAHPCVSLRLLHIVMRMLFSVGDIVSRDLQECSLYSYDDFNFEDFYQIFYGAHTLSR